MFAPPPKINIIAIYSNNCKDLVDFYENLGMLFHLNTLTNEGNYFSYTYGDLVFEIHEVKNEKAITKNLRLRFFIDGIDDYRDDMIDAKVKIIKETWNEDNHQHIIIEDPSGNLVELITKIY